jgi:hypothetical protein
MPCVAAFIGELQAAAGTFEQQASCPQPLQGRGVVAQAMALTDDFAVPLEAEGVQRGEDPPGGTGNFARPVEILQAQQPAAAVGAGVEKARGRGVQRA